MTNKVKNQDPISKEDLYTYLNFVLTNEVEDDDHAKQLSRLARRTTTLSDVVVVANVLMKQKDSTITQLMDAIQVQQRVLEKLGATDDMFKEAEEEYNKLLKETQERLRKEAEEKAEGNYSDGEIQN